MSDDQRGPPTIGYSPIPSGQAPSPPRGGSGVRQAPGGTYANPTATEITLTGALATATAERDAAIADLRDAKLRFASGLSTLEHERDTAKQQLHRAMEMVLRGFELQEHLRELLRALLGAYDADAPKISAAGRSDLLARVRPEVP